MTIRTIAFSIQLGTDGLAIAQTVAARLGFNYLDWNDTSRAAIAAGISPDVIAEFERNRPRLLQIVQKLLTSASMVNDDVSSDATVNPAVMSWAMSSLDTSGYRGFVEDMVRELGSQGGSVIVGHAAQVILREDESTFKVLICGEDEPRSQRLAHESGQSREAAMRNVRQSDRERGDFYKRVYGVDVFAPDLYDLTIRTDAMPREAAIAGILATVHAIGVQAREDTTDHATWEALTTPSEAPPTSEQDAMRRARFALQSLIPEGGPINVPAFRDRLRELQRTFALHVSEAEAPDGTLDDALQRKPYLDRRVKQLREEHVRISQDLAGLLSDLEDTADPEQSELAREHGTRLLVALRLHEASGFDLLYEAYVREEGVG